jgi:hypothetical protein
MAAFAKSWRRNEETARPRPAAGHSGPGLDTRNFPQKNETACRLVPVHQPGKEFRSRLDAWNEGGA